MQYRKLPKGAEQISVLGIGTSSIQASSEKEIEEIMDSEPAKNNCGLGFSVDFHGARAKNVKRHNIDI